MVDIRTLTDEKRSLWTRMQEIWDGAQGEDRAMNEAEKKEYDDLGSKIDAAEARSAEIQEHEQRERDLAAPRRDPRALAIPGEDTEQREQRAAYSRAFNRFVRYGEGDLDADERKLLRSGFQRAGENRAQGEQPGSAGGYLIPTGFQNTIVETLKYFGGVRSVSEVLETSMGNPIEIPTNDDTSNMGRRVADNATATATDLKFGQKELRAYMYSSDLVLVPYSLLQDEAVNLEQYIGRKLAQRIGRIWNYEETTGTGNDMPQGVLQGTTGLTTASASAATYNELVQLEHTVDVAYRGGTPGIQSSPNNPVNDGASYMFADTTLSALRQLADSAGRPLWVPQFSSGVTTGIPATFNGWRYTINNDLPAMGSSVVGSIAFGNFRAGYLIREVQGFTLMRLTERYADQFQVGFLAFARMDATIQDPAAFKLLANHS